MKKIKISTPILILAFVAILFASCSKNAATHIPKDSFAVLVIDGSELMKFSNPDLLKENKDYKDAIKDLEKESKKAAELIEKMMKDPDASGILLSEKSYAFAVLDKEDVIIGVVIPINKKKLEENIDLIADEFKLPVSMFLENKNDIKYFEPEKGMIFGYNEDVLMFVFNENSDDNFKLMESYMNLEEKESVMSNDDFKKFHKNCKAINLWVSSDVIDKVDMDKEPIKEFEKLTGIKIAGNYGHMHLDIQKDQITYTSTLRFNESIQELDTKKLIDNAEKIAELFEGPLMDAFDMFGGSSYDDEDWDDMYGEDYPEMTDEEWEALLQELEEVDANE